MEGNPTEFGYTIQMDVYFSASVIHGTQTVIIRTCMHATYRNYTLEWPNTAHWNATYASRLSQDAPFVRYPMQLSQLGSPCIVRDQTENNFELN